MVDGATAGVDGQFFLALDVAAFEDVERFKSRVDGIVASGSAPRGVPPGVERLYVPGEMEAEFARARPVEWNPAERAARLLRSPLQQRSKAVALPAGWQP
jgi:LDH2 family malate/lactate/ureidoglycolate dehydrogenase